MFTTVSRMEKSVLNSTNNQQIWLFSLNPAYLAENKN